MNGDRQGAAIAPVPLVAIAWLSMAGFDFLLHGGLLAFLYVESSPFLLPSSKAIALLPVGYASLLLVAVLLVWLMRRMRVAGWRPGAVFGLAVGALMSGAFVLGLLSISTADPRLLLGWFLGQTLETAVAGAVVGAGLAGMRLKRLVGRVVALVLLALIATVILQSVGVAPAIHRESSLTTSAR